MDRRETSISGVRVAAAMAVSLACHAVVALALAGQGVRSAAVGPRSTILVRVLGDAEVSGPAGGGAGEPARGAAAAPAVFAPPEPDRVAAAPPPEGPRPVARRPPSVPRLAREPRAPVKKEASSSVEESAIATGAAGAESRGNAGPGGSGAGSGSGGGDGLGGGGGGADGLRAWCGSCPIPEYPPRARRQGWQGTVDVELRVSGDGTVEQARVGRSSGFALLDSAAVTVARRSRFRLPEGGDGLRGQLRYRFVLEEAVAERSL